MTATGSEEPAAAAGSGPRVVVTDWNFPNLDLEREVLADLAVRFESYQCRDEDELIEAAAGADALLVQFAPITDRVIAALPGCRVIVRYGVGVDNIDLEAAARYGVPVAYVPDYCLEEVADHTTALMLSLLRRLPAFDSSVRDNVWNAAGVGGALLALGEVTVGLIGLGRIGSAVVERLRPFGCRLLVHDPFIDPRQAQQLGVELVDLASLFASADAISLHMPLSAASYHLIDAASLAQLKPSAVIVNTARGGLIDAEALATALQEGRIGGAALDVFEQEPLPDDSPLRSCPNLLLTPHAAWYSARSMGRLQQLAAEEVGRALRGEPLRCPVKLG